MSPLSRSRICKALTNKSSKQTCRYRIKGVLNVIFYGPPDHANFYSELLTYPFFKKDVEPSEVTCKVLFSKYDAMALERLVGTKEAAALIRGA